MRILRRRLTTAIRGAFVGLKPNSVTLGRPSDLTTFRAEVLDLLKQKYPNKNSAAAQEDDVIEFDGGSIGLQNIHAIAASLPVQERQAAIGEFLEQLVAITPPPQAQAASWAEVKEFVRPRLVSTDLFQVAPDLLHCPFSPGVVVAYVVDHGPGVRFINLEQAEEWGIGVQSVDRTAVANLEALSVPVRIDVQRTASGSFAAVETNDSYDAARLLLPGLRSRLLAALGDTAIVGIPNRDFLFAWSPDSDLFQNYVAHVRKDFRERAYPITDTIFVVDHSGVRPARAGELSRR